MTNVVRLESQFLKHIACEECGSSDGNSLYSDGHTYCHVCHAWKASEDEVVRETQKPTFTGKPVKIQGDVTAIQDRGISRSTCEFYGVTNENGKQYYPYANQDGAIVAAKVRQVASKDFSVEGAWKDAHHEWQQHFY